MLSLQRGRWHPTPVLLPGKSHGWRSLVGWSPWGREESDTTEPLHFHFSLSCTGEGNGNPLQCSCLENPRDEGAWWAAVYGVAQSRTRLKRLSSSSILLNDCKISYQCSQDIYTILTPIAQRKQRILDCTLHFLPFYFWIDLYMHAPFFLLLLLVHEVLFCIRKWFHPCSGPHHLQSLTQTVNPGPLGTTSILFPLALALSL